MKIGITGSLSSGKTTASKILSARRGPLFSADNVVRKLYRNKSFVNNVRKKFKIQKKISIRKALKDKILNNSFILKKLELLIHPVVRKEMRKFTQSNKKSKFLFFEIPLLVESKLKKYFDLTIFIKARKNIRLKRFKSKGGNRKLFQKLDNRQLSDAKKQKFADYVVVNEKNIHVLKKNLLYILKSYE